MLEQVFENLQKATESSVKMQQEMFRKWMSAFPSSATGISSPGDAVADFRKRFEELATEMVKRQKAMVDQNYEAGLKSLENVFNVAEAKNPQEYQQKLVELYRKSFESLRQLSEAQLQELKSAAQKCAELMTPTSVS
jgi:exonuclease VII large subunit